MDIIELSRKMEGDLLESHPKNPTYLFKKAPPDSNFSPRITRSQSHSVKLFDITETEKPRSQSQPVNKTKDIEKLYLNNKAKVSRKNLETIYEHPLWKKGCTVLLGTSKVKRSLYLDREFRITSKQKSKLRKTKIKRLGKKIKLLKMTDDEFKIKMSKIENYINDGLNGLVEDCNNTDFLNEIVNTDCLEEFEVESSKDSASGSCNSSDSKSMIEDVINEVQDDV